MKNKQHILEELETISPLLAQLKQCEKTLSVPTNYFNNLQENILENIVLENEEFTILNKIKNTTTQTKLPENYFNILQENVLQKIKAEQKISSKKIKIIPLFSKIAIAASIIGIGIFGAKNYLNNQNKTACIDGIACLTQKEIITYIENNTEDFESTDIENTFENVLDNAVIDTQKTTNTTITQKDIENYVNENPATAEIESETSIF